MIPRMPHDAQPRERPAPGAAGEITQQARVLAQEVETSSEGPFNTYCRIPEETNLSTTEQERILQASVEAQGWINTAVGDAGEYLKKPEQKRDPNTERLAEELVIAAGFLNKFLSGLGEKPTNSLQLTTSRTAGQSLKLQLSTATSEPLATYKRERRIGLKIRQVEIDFTFNPQEETDYTTKAIKFRLINGIGDEIACWRLEIHSQEKIPDDKQEIQIDVTRATFPDGNREETKYKHQPLVSLGTGEESLANLGKMQAVVIFNLTQQLLDLRLKHPDSLRSHDTEHEKDLKQLLKAHNAARQQLGMEKNGDSLESYQAYQQEQIRQRQEALTEQKREMQQNEQSREAIERIRQLTRQMAEAQAMRAVREAAENILASRFSREDIPDTDLAACLVLNITPQELTPNLIGSLNGHIPTLVSILETQKLPDIAIDEHPILARAAESIIQKDELDDPQKEQQLAALSRLAAAQKMMELAHPA